MISFTGDKNPRGFLFQTAQVERRQLILLKCLIVKIKHQIPDRYFECKSFVFRESKAAIILLQRRLKRIP